MFANYDMESMVSAFEITLFKAMGEQKNVTQAIESKDLAGIVRSSLRTLNKSDMMSKLVRAAEAKSSEASNKFRREGNEHYQRKRYSEAKECYQKALVYAPNNSMEMKLAYSNISAAQLAMQSYSACMLNIEAALELDCPDSLRIKLKKRKIEAERNLLKEVMTTALLQDQDVLNYDKFEVERNPDIPCVSTDVTVDDDKKVVAAKDIKSGTMVAMERAYVSTQDKSRRYTSCYYCHKLGPFFIPCDGCTKALFCSKICKDTCWEDYHRVECRIANFLYTNSNDVNQELNKLAVKAAIQMSLKLGWEAMRVASLEMGVKIFEKSSVGEAFDCSNPTSLLCFDDRASVPDNIMINKALFCATVLHLIDNVPDYWPKDKKEKQTAMDSLSRVTLHLNTTHKHSIMIPNTVVEEADGIRNMGWFSFGSKLAHSCEPNLLVLGCSDKIALIALQHIKKGDELTISYVDHFYDMNLASENSRYRQRLIKFAIGESCECRVCVKEWHDNSHVPMNLTKSQKIAYKKFKSAMKTTDFKLRMTAINTALDELTGCINTTPHYNVCKGLKETLTLYRCIKILNDI